MWVSLRLCASAREYCFYGIANYLWPGPEARLWVASQRGFVKTKK